MAVQAVHIHTEETKVKICEAHLGKIHLQESCAKLSAALKEKKHYEEARAKLTATMLNRKGTKQTNEKKPQGPSAKLFQLQIVNQVKFVNTSLLNMQLKGLILPVQE